MTLHVGFTGTRFGMTTEQFRAVRRLIPTGPFTAHHGDCVGADAEFHEICTGLATIEVHPGPISDLSAGCPGHVRHDPRSHMVRNAAIVAASQVMIAAPPQDDPQSRGGTWATIGMARRALRAGKLRELYVVGRGGQLLRHEEWP